MSDGPQTPGGLAGPDRIPEGLRMWTTDMCAHVVFSAVKRPKSHYARFPIPRRRWEFRSINPIRAVAIGQVGEVCRQHYARLVKCRDNRWRVVFCVVPAAGMKRFGIANIFIVKARAAAVGVYMTPFWTEFHLHSNVRRCGGVLT